ncbi:MAG: EF-hand domain-containing protein [Alphaproteobacteria bacterium]
MSISSLGLSSLFTQQSYSTSKASSLFKQADTNQDEGVTFQEFAILGQSFPNDVQDASKTQEMFNEIDANGDGIITQEEDSAFQTRIAEETQAALLQVQETDDSGDGISADDIFSKLDADGDGSISSDELAEAFGLSAEQASTLLSEVDTDGDGVISQAENEAHLSAMEENKQAGAPPPPPPPEEDEETSETEESDDDILASYFDQMDTNQDGNISASEIALFVDMLKEQYGEDNSNTSGLSQAIKSYSSAASEYFNTAAVA